MKRKSAPLLYIDHYYEDITSIHLVDTENIQPALVKKLIGSNLGSPYSFKTVKASKLLKTLQKQEEKRLHDLFVEHGKLLCMSQKDLHDKFLLNMKEYEEMQNKMKKSNATCNLFKPEEMNVIVLRNENMMEINRSKSCLKNYKKI